MTTGNIYRYFKNKEDLFVALIQPVYEEFKQFIISVQEDIDCKPALHQDEDPMYLLQQVERTVIELFRSSSVEVRILLNLSEGSAYAMAKQEFIQLISNILEKVMLVHDLESHPDEPVTAISLEEQHVARMLAAVLVEGVSIILRDHENPEVVQRLVNELLHVYCEGLYCKLHR